VVSLASPVDSHPEGGTPGAGRGRGSVDGAVDPTPAEEGRIGRVDDASTSRVVMSPRWARLSRPPFLPHGHARQAATRARATRRHHAPLRGGGSIVSAVMSRWATVLPLCLVAAVTSPGAAARSTRATHQVQMSSSQASRPYGSQSGAHHRHPWPPPEGDVIGRHRPEWHRDEQRGLRRWDPVRHRPGAGRGEGRRRSTPRLRDRHRQHDRECLRIPRLRQTLLVATPSG